MLALFPTIFALGLKGLGPNTKLAGSPLVMTIVGGALFPLVLGYIARSTGSLALGYIVPLVGFAVVSLYGFAAPWILPPSGNTDPEAGELVAERGQEISGLLGSWLPILRRPELLVVEAQLNSA